MSSEGKINPPTSLFADVLPALRETSVWQERVYKQLHAHSDLSFQETETAALAAKRLKGLGYEVIEGVGRTGVVGVLRNGELAGGGEAGWLQDTWTRKKGYLR